MKILSVEFSLQLCLSFQLFAIRHFNGKHLCICYGFTFSSIFKIFSGYWKESIMINNPFSTRETLFEGVLQGSLLPLLLLNIFIFVASSSSNQTRHQLCSCDTFFLGSRENEILNYCKYWRNPFFLVSKNSIQINFIRFFAIELLTKPLKCYVVENC